LASCCGELGFALHALRAIAFKIV
jgi:hypothetical protein